MDEDGIIGLSQDVRHIKQPKLITPTRKERHRRVPLVPEFGADLDRDILRHIESRPRPIPPYLKEWTPPSLGRLLKFAPPKPTTTNTDPGIRSSNETIRLLESLVEHSAHTFPCKRSAPSCESSLTSKRPRTSEDVCLSPKPESSASSSSSASRHHRLSQFAAAAKSSQLLQNVV
uniref:Uncharacterized protein n=1 Tax=Spongospora subterranea TaxID=70186 RepID=A0A0H5R7C5_9EUKA|eukprot:CRZ10055.1 hypothetical protein [Spongospora subterranea]